MRLLAAHDRSRAELSARLSAAGHPEPELRAALGRLAELGYLDDARLAAAEVARFRGRLGPAGAEAKLLGRGLSPELAKGAAEALRAGEASAARALCAERYGAPPFEPKVLARAARFLAGRGFSAEVVEALLPRDDDVR